MSKVERVEEKIRFGSSSIRALDPVADILKWCGTLVLPTIDQLQVGVSG